jgi:tRNA 2-thiouridine synthesizing protein A
MNGIVATKILDTSGKCCPMPMVETNQAIKELAGGEILEIIATDVATKTDIPSWCQRTGNALLGMSEENQVLHYYVRKHS